MRFVVLIFVLSALLFYTRAKVAVLTSLDSSQSTVVATLIILSMVGTMILQRSKVFSFESKFYKALSWAGSTLMALWSTIVILSLPLDLFVSLEKYFLHSSDASFYYRLNFIVLFLSFTFVFLGIVTVLRGPHVKEIDLKVDNLPEILKGLKIVQLSDIHVGPTIRRPYVQDMVDKANTLNADLVFLTGDIADAKAESIVFDLAPLGELKSKLGNFYVTGNHEYYWDAPGLIEEVKKLGMIPLLNENRVLQKENSKFMIAGVTDPAGSLLGKEHAPDLEKAALSQEQSSLKILLAHQPNIAPWAARYNFDLQFSGHTHAGQFFPFTLIVARVQKFFRGPYKLGKTWVYVNPGTGYWGPPSRLGARAEISLITLC